MSEEWNPDFCDPMLELQALVEPYYGMYLLDTVRRYVIPLKPTPDYADRVGRGVRDWEPSDLLDQLFDQRDLCAMRAALSPEAVRVAFAQLSERRVLQYRQAGSGWVKIILQPHTMEQGITTLALLTHMRIPSPLANRPLEDPTSARLRVNLTTDRVSAVTLRDGMVVDEQLDGTWTTHYQHFLQAVHPEDRNTVVMRTHPSILLGRPDGDEVTCSFRARYDEQYLRFYMGVHKCVEPGGAQIVKIFFEAIPPVAGE